MSVGNLRTRGMSLLEVILSTFLFLTLTAIATGYFVSTSSWVDRTRAKMLGSFVAEGVMEQVKEKGFDEVESLAGTGRYDMDVERFGVPLQYAVEYEIAIVEVEPNLKSVKVEVTYARDKSFLYETFLVPRF